MTLYDAVKKLIGPVTPAGDAAIDPERFENLKALAELTAHLVEDLHDVTKYKTSFEGSVKKAGKFADINMQELKCYFE